MRNYISLIFLLFVANAFSQPPCPTSIDSIYANTTQFCVSKEIRMYFLWGQEKSEVEWSLPSDFRLIEGGGLNDNFVEGIILDSGDLNFSVTPKDSCELRTDRIINVPFATRLIISRSICEGDCFYYQDTCYYESGDHFINLEDVNTTCTSNVVSVRVNYLDVFPSPDIQCVPTSDGVLVEWDGASGVDSYIVYLNRDSITTVTDRFYLIENIPIDSSVSIKIQPIGGCSYLPAEINCTNTISSSSDLFLKDKITVYPNPTTGIVNIETDLQVQGIEVFGVAGDLLQKEKTTSFDLKNHSLGIYFLKIKTNEGVGVKRISVN